jgi:hypothetical protein
MIIHLCGIQLSVFCSAELLHKFSVVSWVCRGTDVSIENMHQGFTHVFESTFESTEGVKEYIEHPAHVEYANELLPLMEKVLIIDYKPAAGKA